MRDHVCVQIKASSLPSSGDRLKMWMLFTLLFAYLCWLAEGLNIDGVQTLGVLVSAVRQCWDDSAVLKCCRCVAVQVQLVAIGVMAIVLLKIEAPAIWKAAACSDICRRQSAAVESQQNLEPSADYRLLSDGDTNISIDGHQDRPDA